MENYISFSIIYIEIFPFKPQPLKPSHPYLEPYLGTTIVMLQLLGLLGIFRRFRGLFSAYSQDMRQGYWFFGARTRNRRWHSGFVIAKSRYYSSLRACAAPPFLLPPKGVRYVRELDRDNRWLWQIPPYMAIPLLPASLRQKKKISQTFCKKIACRHVSMYVW